MLTVTPRDALRVEYHFVLVTGMTRSMFETCPPAQEVDARPLVSTMKKIDLLTIIS